MRKWHYVTLEFTLDDLTNVDWLNGYGDQGLELIWLERINSQPLKWLAFFKKEIGATANSGE